MRDDPALTQVANVACLPGIVGYSLAMPDIHWGYGFPIGGVAAVDAHEGVISPGGVGYDINCGVRLARTNLHFNSVEPKIDRLADALFNKIPAGVGSWGAIPGLSIGQLKDVVRDGAKWALRNGYATERDLEHTEEGGRLPGADPDRISERAYQRGSKQLGTLGSGNHFLEVGRVDEIYDSKLADALGLELDQVTIMIHSGSRGLGHQTCDDHLKVILGAMARYGISLPDRQLAAVPISSAEGQAYLAAMAAAANFAWCNRQVMMHLAEQAFLEALSITPKELNFELVYDVCHNIAKFEEHTVDGHKRLVCVHRKGATRAFGPGHAALPEALRPVGQPVLIPGDMGRYSFVLVGLETAMRETFGSSCHGAGRLMSRTKAKREVGGRDLRAELKALGVTVRAHTRAGIAEEMPHAYKDVAEVVEVMEAARVTRRVARLKPFAVIKG
ncbi:RtcB family protein [Candidatus Binatus sp.]|uniref:RtcB family protein n=1 Tax=Candidatus Binatus sp. TaxID=2811406 RepID=UPI00272BC0A2|nr:RtcB family protein [Candidatus Binatus sp.]